MSKLTIGSEAPYFKGKDQNGDKKRGYWLIMADDPAPVIWYIGKQEIESDAIHQHIIGTSSV